MNIRFLNMLGLSGCLMFLIGNITYDILDTPESPADYRIFYIPFSFMTFSLLTLAKDYAKKQTHTLFVLWWGFWWLSIGQCIKFLFFNPFLQMISDYGFLAFVIAGVIYRINANK